MVDQNPFLSGLGAAAAVSAAIGSGRRRALPPSRAQRSNRLFWRFAFAGFAVLACAAAIFDGAFDDAATNAAARRAPSAPPKAWIEITPPSELFRIEPPDFAREPRLQEARRHRTGGGRQDMWIFGDANGASPFFRMAIYKVGAEPAPGATFFVDLARRAAEMGQAITRSAQPAALPTRFGNFEVAELSLLRKGASESACLGFRFAADAPGLRVTGFACAGTGAAGPPPLSKAALGCLIDGIALAGPSNDAELAALFAAPPRKDPACLARRTAALVRR